MLALLITFNILHSFTLRHFNSFNFIRKATNERNYKNLKKSIFLSTPQSFYTNKSRDLTLSTRSDTLRLTTASWCPWSSSYFKSVSKYMKLFESTGRTRISDNEQKLRTTISIFFTPWNIWRINKRYFGLKILFAWDRTWRHGNKCCWRDFTIIPLLRFCWKQQCQLIERSLRTAQSSLEAHRLKLCHLQWCKESEVFWFHTPTVQA